MRQLLPPPNAEAPACQPDRPHVFADDLLPTAAATAAGPYLHISLSTLGRPMIKLVTQWETLQGDPDPDWDQRRIEAKKPDLTLLENPQMSTRMAPLLEELPLKGKYSLIHLLRRVGRPAKSVLAVWQAAVAAQRRSMRADPQPWLAPAGPIWGASRR